MFHGITLEMKYTLSAIILGLIIGVISFFNTSQPIPAPATKIDTLPLLQHKNGFIISNDGSISTPFTLHIEHDLHTLSMYIHNEAIHFEAQLSNTLNIISESEEALTKNETQKFTKKVIEVNQTNTSLQFFKDDLLIKEKVLHPDSPILSIGTLIPYLQSTAGIDHNEFTINWLLPNVFWTQRLYVSKTVVSDIQKLPRYSKIPKSVLDVLASKKPFVFYTLKPKGLFSFFLKDPYYFVFDHDEPYSFIASWGGPSPHVMYQIIP